MASSTQKKSQSRVRAKGKIHKNIRPSILILLIPIAIGGLTLAIIAFGIYSRSLAIFGSNRLVTDNWQAAQRILLKQQPVYKRQYAYYNVKEGQTKESIAEFFGVTVAELSALNPNPISTATNIKVPPVTSHFTPVDSNGLLSSATISEDQGMLTIRSKYGEGSHVVTNLPEIKQLLEPYNAIEQTGPTEYRINKPISIDGDIRVDITKSTVTKIQLLSSSTGITCLCFNESSALIDGVNITSYDPSTSKPDTNHSDGRSFVRMKNGRMDILNSKLSYLGNGIEHVSQTSALYPLQKDGGFYGVSWRISGDQFGRQIASGWIQNNTFEHNYFGSYSFGASGMTWKGNKFNNNLVYGLDPHDDSNNALIEDNIFIDNGKHGLILSKRCNYNIIRHNLSIGNKANGFMLHETSSYNLLEKNISTGNVDNYVIYASNYNTLLNNQSYNPSGSHIRINSGSSINFITGNTLSTGPKGIYLYDKVANTYIEGNTIQDVGKELQTYSSNNILFVNNVVGGIRYDIEAGNRMIFGPNKIKRKSIQIPTNKTLISQFQH